MDRDANYVAVGTFVVLVLAMATIFVLWYTNARDRREFVRHEVYFTGSVFGLNEGSTVRYLGVNVGRVSRIRLDPRSAGRVLALIDLDAATPIAPDTVARLSLQGVTGLLFIDLGKGSPAELAQSVTAPSIAHPVIPSLPSNFDLLLSGLPDLLARVTEVVDGFNELLSPDNVAALDATIQSFRAASEPLPGVVQDVARLARELRSTTERANRLLEEGGPQATEALARLNELSGNLVKLTARVDALVARSEPGIDRLTSQGVQELQLLLRESRDAAAEVRSLARTLREQPSRLIRERPAAGVEIER